MKTLMDELQYTATEQGNVTKMVKRGVIGGRTDA
jgi:hypothetical protein